MALDSFNSFEEYERFGENISNLDLHAASRVKSMTDAEVICVDNEEEVRMFQLANNSLQNSTCVAVNAIGVIAKPWDTIVRLSNALEVSVTCVGAAEMHDRRVEAQRRGAVEGHMMDRIKSEERGKSIGEANNQVDYFGASLPEMYQISQEAVNSVAVEVRARKAVVELEVEYYRVTVQREGDVGKWAICHSVTYSLCLSTTVVTGPSVGSSSVEWNRDGWM